eukprot:GHVT01045869.1.p1 GENE.GHVT01045869.1~~GHVT01045869.1.p1  ORF type:complete len:163 (-),score=15.81 GHVT01045869.1:330-818(-)
MMNGANPYPVKQKKRWMKPLLLVTGCFGISALVGLAAAVAITKGSAFKKADATEQPPAEATVEETSESLPAESKKSKKQTVAEKMKYFMSGGKGGGKSTGKNKTTGSNAEASAGSDNKLPLNQRIDSQISNATNKVGNWIQPGVNSVQDDLTHTNGRAKNNP